MLTERTKIKFKIPSRRRFVDDFVVKNRQVLAARIRSMKNVWGGEGELNCITSVGVIGKCRCLLRREIRNSIDSITREHAILRSTFETVSNTYAKVYVSECKSPLLLGLWNKMLFHGPSLFIILWCKILFRLFFTILYANILLVSFLGRSKKRIEYFYFFFLNLNNKEFNFLSWLSWR